MDLHGFNKPEPALLVAVGYDTVLCATCKCLSALLYLYAFLYVILIPVNSLGYSVRAKLYNANATAYQIAANFSSSVSVN
jgi:hypothetical protein